VIGVALGVAVLVAVLAVGIRRWQQARARRSRPGATIHRAVPVSRFDEIDATVQGRVCWCGGTFAVAGETSRAIGEHRFRVARLVCQDCERDELIFFDVTAVFQ
jgi:hypothetical protein